MITFYYIKMISNSGFTSPFLLLKLIFILRAKSEENKIFVKYSLNNVLNLLLFLVTSNLKSESLSILSLVPSFKQRSVHLKFLVNINCHMKYKVIGLRHLKANFLSFIYYTIYFYKYTVHCECIYRYMCVYYLSYMFNFK